MQQPRAGALVRLHHLDALRGIAAVVVLIYHLRGMFTLVPPSFLMKPVFAGTKSVTLFFVLSGYVLSFPYVYGRQTDYGTYLIRRFFRIYVPYFAAVAFAAAMAAYLGCWHTSLNLTSWFFRTWQQPVTPMLVGKQLLFMFGKHESAVLNVAFWSLQVEVQMSLLFPFLCRAVLRSPSALGWLLVMVLDYVGMGRLDGHLPGFMVGWSGSFLWLAAFTCGALLAKDKPVIRGWYERTGLIVRCAFVVATVVAYYHGAGNELTTVPATCGILILVENSMIRRALNARIPVYLGKISYSLYLLHSTVLMACIILLYGRIPFVAMCCVYGVVTFVLADLSYRFIETPAMDAGRSLTKQPIPKPQLTSV